MKHSIKRTVDRGRKRYAGEDSIYSRTFRSNACLGWSWTNLVRKYFCLAGRIGPKEVSHCWQTTLSLVGSSDWTTRFITVPRPQPRKQKYPHYHRWFRNRHDQRNHWSPRLPRPGLRLRQSLRQDLRSQSTNDQESLRIHQTQPRSQCFAVRLCHSRWLFRRYRRSWTRRGRFRDHRRWVNDLVYSSRVASIAPVCRN